MGVAEIAAAHAAAQAQTDQQAAADRLARLGALLRGAITGWVGAPDPGAAEVTLSAEGLPQLTAEGLTWDLVPAHHRTPWHRVTGVPVPAGTTDVEYADADPEWTSSPEGQRALLGHPLTTLRAHVRCEQHGGFCFHRAEFAWTSRVWAPPAAPGAAATQRLETEAERAARVQRFWAGLHAALQARGAHGQCVGWHAAHQARAQT